MSGAHPGMSGVHAVEHVHDLPAALIHVVERDYRTIYDKYTSIGPLLSKNGGGNRGIKWDLDPEITELCQLNGTVQEGVAKGRPKMETDINAANFILRVSPETNGALSYRSWDFFKEQIGRAHV